MMEHYPVVEQTIAGLQPGDHLCSLYSGDDEHCETLAAFLSAGQRMGQKVLFITGSPDPEKILACLAGKGIAAAEAAASGQLILRPISVPEGGFQPQLMLDWMNAEAEKALAEGCPPLRVCIDMNWASAAGVDSSALVEYELGQNALPLVDRMILLCLYDRRLFDAHMLLPVLQAHPAVVVGLQVVPNRFYIPPQSAGKRELSAAWLDSCLEVLADGSERMRYQQELKRTLEEKEVVLREIHHRVKNNLSVIIALIGLQEGSSTNPAVTQIFKDLQTRVYSMALVHESLYRAPDLARVNFASYLKTLTAHLYQIYARPGSGPGACGLVQIRVEAEDVALRVDTAIPCGLIVNELVTNALKYAFPPDLPASGEECEVLVSLARIDDTIVLKIADNGVGFPPDLDWQSAPTLGLQMAQVLARQLKARLELAEYAAGVCWALEFEDSK